MILLALQPIKTLEANNKKVLIVTGDKDALQLINDDISVLLTKKGISEMLEFDKLFKETYENQNVIN